MTTTPYHHGALRATLLAAAERAIAAGGVDALSLRGLAREIGVSHGAPNRHFPDKQSLLNALSADGFRRLSAAMEDAASGDHPVTNRLSAVGRAYVQFAIDNAALLDVMYRTKHDPTVSPELAELADRTMRISTTIIAEAQRVGAVRPGDPIRYAVVAFATAHGIAILATGDLLDGIPVDDVVDAGLEVLLRGLA